jgi:hypothetical protein
MSETVEQRQNITIITPANIDTILTEAENGNALAIITMQYARKFMDRIDEAACMQCGGKFSVDHRPTIYVVCINDRGVAGLCGKCLDGGEGYEQIVERCLCVEGTLRSEQQ